MVDAAEQAGVTLMVALQQALRPGLPALPGGGRGRCRAARLLRVTTLESPLQPYVAHYPLRLAAARRPTLASGSRPRPRRASPAAIGDADESSGAAYQLVLLDTLVHELNTVRGLLGEPDRLDYVDLRERSLTVMLRFGEPARSPSTGSTCPASPATRWSSRCTRRTGG